MARGIRWCARFAREPPAIRQHTSGVPKALVIEVEATPTSAADFQVQSRLMTATFYRSGSVSTMWPPGDHPQLHDYPASRWKRWWNTLRA